MDIKKVYCVLVLKYYLDKVNWNMSSWVSAFEFYDDVDRFFKFIGEINV